MRTEIPVSDWEEQAPAKQFSTDIKNKPRSFSRPVLNLEDLGIGRMSI